MATVRDLVKGSLRLLGVLATGENPSAEEHADALSALNDLVDSWSNERLLIFGVVAETFSLAASKAVYTIGPTGDFPTTRPMRLENAAIIIPGNTPALEVPLQILSDEEWADISTKNVTSNFPRKIYAEGNFPIENLHLYPVPSLGCQLVLYSWKPISSFASANAAISFPPGYAKALRYNLALELAPEYGREPSGSLLSAAMESKENVKRLNIKPVYLGVDEALMRRSSTFNYLTGE